MDETHIGRRGEDLVHDDGGSAARAALVVRVIAIEAAGVKRRHEELLDIAVDADGLSRELAEQAHELAEEEGLAPAYGLALVACGIGVEDLVPPESPDDDSLQPTAPAWIDPGDLSQEGIARERHLRASFRRLRAHLEREPDAAHAVASFLAEPDVGPINY